MIEMNEDKVEKLHKIVMNAFLNKQKILHSDNILQAENEEKRIIIKIV